MLTRRTRILQSLFLVIPLLMSASFARAELSMSDNCHRMIKELKSHHQLKKTPESKVELLDLAMKAASDEKGPIYSHAQGCEMDLAFYTYNDGSPLNLDDRSPSQASATSKKNHSIPTAKGSAGSSSLSSGRGEALR